MDTKESLINENNIVDIVIQMMEEQGKTEEPYSKLTELVVSVGIMDDAHQ